MKVFASSPLFETETEVIRQTQSGDKDIVKEGTRWDYLPDREIKEVLSSSGTLFGRHSGDVKRPLIR